MSTMSKTNNGPSKSSGISKKSKKSTKSIPAIATIVPDSIDVLSPVGRDPTALVWKAMYEQLLQQVAEARTEAACAHAVARHKFRIPESKWTRLVAAQKQSLSGTSEPQRLLLSLVGRPPPPAPNTDSDDDDDLLPPPTSTKSTKIKKKRSPQPRSAANHYCHFMSPILRFAGVPSSGTSGCMAVAMKEFAALDAEQKAPFVSMKTSETESMKSTGDRLTEAQLCEFCPDDVLSDYKAAKKALAAAVAARSATAVAATAPPADTDDADADADSDGDGMDDEADADDEE